MKKFKNTCLWLVALWLVSGVVKAETMNWTMVPNKSSHVVKKGWLYETGDMSGAGRIFGQYTLQERLPPRKSKGDKIAEFVMVVVFGNEQQQSLVLQGRHDYRRKQYQGTVTAASNAKNALIGYQISADEASGQISLSGPVTTTVASNKGQPLSEDDMRNLALSLASQRMGLPVYQLLISPPAIMQVYGIHAFSVRDGLHQQPPVEINLYTDGTEVSEQALRDIALEFANPYVGKVSKGLLQSLESLANGDLVGVTVVLDVPQGVKDEYNQLRKSMPSVVNFYSNEWLQAVAEYKTHCDAARAPFVNLMTKQEWTYDDRIVLTTDPAISPELCQQLYIKLPKERFNMLEADSQVIQLNLTEIYIAH